MNERIVACDICGQSHSTESHQSIIENGTQAQETKEEKELRIKSFSQSIGFVSPERYELVEKAPELLWKGWRKNHKAIRAVVQAGRFPFFGLHGTSADSYDSIKSADKAYLEIATFYNKSKDELFSYQLYHLADYATGYAELRSEHKSEPGIIAIFHLEDDERNITIPWERLLSGSGLMPGAELSFCSSKENKNFKLLDQRENLLFRTDMYFKSVDDYLAGDIRLDELQKYFEANGLTAKVEIGKIILIRRLQAQEVVMRALATVATL